MHFSSLIGISALLAAASTSAEVMSVTYNTVLDDPDRTLKQVACWDDENGILPGQVEWEVQGNVGYALALESISGSKSKQCATCWEVQYGERITHFVAIDHADSGVVMGLDAMNYLTGDKAEKLGSVEVNATQVGLFDCGIYNPGEL
ncbi:hypothetical protein ACJ41O_006326 [Fusarium nematophilum]